MARGIPESAPYQPWTDNGDGNVTLNVEVVPGLYYAADSAGKMSVAERRTPYEPPSRRRRAMRLSRRGRRGREQADMQAKWLLPAGYKNHARRHP